LLHEVGSSSPVGISSLKDKIKFYRYFYLKDLFILFIFFIFFFFITFYYPNILGHSDNYIKANALVTPTHIVPE
jgi:ubiquinol-cytochrome c reductase cytochrome b subunit